MHLTVVFDVNDEQRRNEFIMDLLPQALDSLDEQARPTWGKMTPQQMVEHLIWGFDLSTGKATTEWMVPQEMGQRMKAFLYNDQPNSKNYQHPALAQGLPSLKYPNLAAAKRALIEARDSFLNQSEAAKKAMHLHPIFGPLKYEEWERMHFKHSIHHLLQFGLIVTA